MGPKWTEARDRRRPISRTERDRLARRAARLWGYVTLGGISTLALLIIWHLVRRGRLLRARSLPVKDVGLPPPDPAARS